MTLRSRKSLSRLASWFNSHTPSKQTQANTVLIWILLTPGKNFNPGDLYHSNIEGLKTALSTENGVQSVIGLINTSPSALSFNAPASARSTTSAKTHPDCILVEVEYAAFQALVEKVRALLTVGEIAIDKSSGQQLLHWNISTYTLVQRYEPRVSRGIASDCVVTVAMEPAPGQEGDVDLWYRRDVLPALGALSPGLFLRCRRYVRIQDPPSCGQMDGLVAAKVFLAVQEYSSIEKLLRHSIEKGRLVEETELGTKVLDTAKSVERVVWKLHNRREGERGRRSLTEHPAGGQGHRRDYNGKS